MEHHLRRSVHRVVIAALLLAAMSAACADDQPADPVAAVPEAAAPPAEAAAQAETPDYGAPAWAQDGGPSVPWVQLVCGTLAVCGLICFAVFAVKKLNGGLPMNRGRYLELLESRTVGRNLRLFLVKVAGRVVLLAATDQSASCVAEFTDEELPQEAVGAGAPAGAAFGSLLKRLAGVKG